MTRIYLADAKFAERLAMRMLILNRNMMIVGEAADWSTTFAQVPVSHPDILVVDWNLLSSMPASALQELRKACSFKLFIVLISHLNILHQSVFFIGADTFISKAEIPEYIVELLQSAADCKHLK